METPKKHNAQNTSNMLKEVLQNEGYLKALRIIERAEKNALRNGLYSTNYE